MGNELVKYTTDHGEIVLSNEIIRNYLVPKDSKVTDQELYLYMKLCQRQGLDPFLREVYLVKYGDNPASMVTGKEVFTKRANAHPGFDGLEAGIVVINNGKILRREGSIKMPGEQLVGGWAKVHMKGHSISSTDEVSLEEYIGTGPLWKSKPATMIRKVAIVHALREAFPEQFEGLYSQEEINKIDASALPETPVVMKDVTNDEPNIVPIADADGVIIADAIDVTPEPKQAPVPAVKQDDINKVFLPDVQYRVDKASAGVNKTNGKAYMKLLIKDAGFTLEVYDYENTAVNDGDFIIIRTMRPIKSREYNGRTYYSTSATIDLANTLKQAEPDMDMSDADQYELPFTV